MPPDDTIWPPPPSPHPPRIRQAEGTGAVSVFLRPMTEEERQSVAVYYSVLHRRKGCWDYFFGAVFFLIGYPLMGLFLLSLPFCGYDQLCHWLHWPMLPHSITLLALLTGCALGLVAGNWTLFEQSREESRQIAMMKRDTEEILAMGQVEVWDCSVVQVLRLRLDDDEDIAQFYLFDTGDGRLLLTTDFTEEAETFPCTRFQVIRLPTTNHLLRVQFQGQPLDALGDLIVEDLTAHESENEMLIQDLMVFDGAFQTVEEDLRRQGIRLRTINGMSS